MPRETNVSVIAPSIVTRSRLVSDAEQFEPGSMEVEGEPVADARPAVPAQGVPSDSPSLAVKEPAQRELSVEQRELSNALARHWLVQLAAGADLLPPDPRALPASPSLEEIWTSLASRNNLSDADLAVQVAKVFKLPVAQLDRISPAVLDFIPDKIARKLGVIPVSGDAKNLVVAISDPRSVEIKQQLAFVNVQAAALPHRTAVGNSRRARLALQGVSARLRRARGRRRPR